MEFYLVRRTSADPVIVWLNKAGYFKVMDKNVMMFEDVNDIPPLYFDKDFKIVAFALEQKGVVKFSA
jgi:hypothetical protein